MKILIVNYRYFVSGGPERYMFNVIDELNSRGHEIIPFSIKYTKNIPSDYDKYFIDPLGSKEEVLFRNQKMTRKSVYRTILRLFYDPEVERAIGNLISDTKPQIAYVLNFMKKMSPAVMVGIKNKGLPLVVRLSDYGIICPGVHCIRDNEPCELCIPGNILPSVRYRCVQNSLIASSLNAVATQYHRSKKYFDLVDQFVVTNDFMHKMMVKAGYSKSRLRIIPTLVRTEDIKGKILNKPPLIVFVGRTERVKGVHVLLSAISQLRKKYSSLEFIVNIAGSGDTQYVTELKSFVSSNDLENHVKLLGELNYTQISYLYQNALISIIPSIWYENLPNSLLESFTFGVPVIGSNIGSLSGVIKDQQNGLLFEPGNENDLADKIKFCLDNPNLVMEWGKSAKVMAENEFSSEIHATKLLTLFDELVNKD